MRKASYALVLSAFCLNLSTASVARADEDPHRKEAEALLKEGIALHEANKEEDALASYERADAVYPTANILFARASAEQILGRTMVALRHYREALKSRTLHPKNVERGKEYVGELEGKICRLDVKAPAGAMVKVDGAAFTAGEPLDLEPSEHVVDATLADKHAHQTISCSRGQMLVLQVAFDGTTSAPTIVTDPPREERGSTLLTTRNVVGGAAAVLGVAAAVLGVVFLADSNGKVDDARSYNGSFPGGACAGGFVGGNARCSEYDRLSDDASSSRTASQVALGVAGALAVTSVAVFTLWPARKRGADVKAGFAPGGVQLMGRF